MWEEGLRWCNVVAIAKVGGFVRWRRSRKIERLRMGAFGQVFAKRPWSGKEHRIKQHPGWYFCEPLQRFDLVPVEALLW
jgi:hypothetical protein